MTVSEDAKVVIIEGYASFNKDHLGTKEVDRDSEIVDVQGLDLEDYLKNPIVLSQHEWDKPFGKVTNIYKDQFGLYVTAEIHKLSGMETEFEAVLKGIVKAFSIGFIALEYQFLDMDVVEITKSKLLEISAVSIPANASSLFQVVGTKSINLNKDTLKYALEVNNITNATVKTVSDSKGNQDMIITKDAQTVSEGTEPTATPQEPVVEAKPAETNVSPKATPQEPVVEPKPEPVAKPADVISLETLVTAMVEAELKADAAKESAKAEALKKEQEEAAAKVAAEEARVADALNYIKEKREAILNTPAGEIDMDAIDSFYEVLSDTVEAIDSKVLEVVEALKASQTPAA